MEVPSCIGSGCNFALAVVLCVCCCLLSSSLCVRVFVAGDCPIARLATTTTCTHLVRARKGSTKQTRSIARVTRTLFIVDSLTSSPFFSYKQSDDLHTLCRPSLPTPLLLLRLRLALISTSLLLVGAWSVQQ